MMTYNIIKTILKAMFTGFAAYYVMLAYQAYKDTNGWASIALIILFLFMAVVCGWVRLIIGKA